MAIRLGNSCINCENLTQEGACKIHMVAVSNNYTCDHFSMKATLKDDRNCVTCTRFHESDCANPQAAAPGMLCTHWAPQNATA
ncbi:hypothetical protein [Aquimarina agarivorans]|uniref:hypothetical protein n=1 Tax=Aquimarina agarivorans TaxID=980584 RepID=UPI000248FDC2|nr:hypothetical protein [Aquimarina agarivorans]